MTKALKIIQWATGNIGAKSLRAVIEHPHMELVGLWVSSPEKVGRDAGELCGLDQTVGITATSDVDELVALDADCVLHMRQGSDVEEFARLLASGKNVVTTRGDFHYPPMMDADARARIEAACKEGGTSIYSTGSSPGFATEAVPMVLLSLSRSLDCITIDEFADCSSRNSPDMLFNIMGFGKPMRPFEEATIAHVKNDFAASLAQLADASGVKIDEWRGEGEFSPVKDEVTIAAGTIDEGTVGAQRITITGMADGKPRFRFRANWYASTNIENEEWELRESGWRMQVKGDTPLDVSISFPVAPEDYAAFTPGLTGHRAVNAVRAVCASEPGIRTTADLPQVVAEFG